MRHTAPVFDRIETDNSMRDHFTGKHIVEVEHLQQAQSGRTRAVRACAGALRAAGAGLRTPRGVLSDQWRGPGRCGVDLALPVRPVMQRPEHEVLVRGERACRAISSLAQAITTSWAITADQTPDSNGRHRSCWR